MGIVFVDWNLVWVWGMKIRGGKRLLIGIADWNFSLLMGIVFLGNPEKEKSWVWGLKIKGGNTWLSWVHVWGLKIRGGNTHVYKKNTVTHCLQFKKHSDSLANTETSSYLFLKKN